MKALLIALCLTRIMLRMLDKMSLRMLDKMSLRMLDRTSLGMLDRTSLGMLDRLLLRTIARALQLQPFRLSERDLIRVGMQHGLPKGSESPADKHAG
jgi:hypothetical protein